MIGTSRLRFRVIVAILLALPGSVDSRSALRGSPALATNTYTMNVAPRSTKNETNSRLMMKGANIPPARRRGHG